MYAEIFIEEPVPPNVGQSYGFLKYGKYGICRWVYANEYCGPPHWINWLKTHLKPEYPCPIAFEYYFWPGTVATVSLKSDLFTNIPDIIINTVPTNLLKGKGIPIRPAL